MILAVDGPVEGADPEAHRVFGTGGYVGWPILVNVVLDALDMGQYEYVLVTYAGWQPPKGAWLKNAIETLEEEDDTAVVTLGVPEDWQTLRGAMPVEERGYWIVPRVWGGVVGRATDVEQWRCVPYLPVGGDVMDDFSEFMRGRGVALRLANWDNPPFSLDLPEPLMTMGIDGGLHHEA